MNQLALVQVHKSGEESAPNMVLWRVHMEPFSMWLHGRRSNRPLCFITYYGTLPMPTSWQTTSGIHRRNLACGGRRLPRESDCAGGIEWSLCRLPVQQAVPLGYSESEWRIEPVSSGRAYIQFENQWISTNLNIFNSINTFNYWYNDNNINNYNKLLPMMIKTITTIMTIMTIITIVWIVIYFQGWDECTIK